MKIKTFHNQFEKSYEATDAFKESLVEIKKRMEDNADEAGN